MRSLLPCMQVVLAAVLSLAGQALARAEERAEQLQVEARQGMLRVLSRHCGDCHGAEEPEAGLNLADTGALLRGGTGGPVILPGDAARSRLVQVLAKDARPHMPPEGQLSAKEIGAVSRWIDLLDPTTSVGGFEISAADRSHWSFQPLVRPQIPPVQQGDVVRTPIDRFVAARLEQDGLALSPPAAKAVRLRRLYFDLVGLPPGVEQVRAFESSTAPDAWERVVDELLASPHYGERWGRHWLDLARYADSSGFHEDFDRPNAWRYRDYVIGSLNADKPLGDFVREQLAGDELPDATVETWTATGFLRNGPSNESNMGKGIAREQYRLDQLDGIVSTVSTVMLGLTIGCARCHDHMYDPVSQQDYYRTLAVFDSTRNARVPLESFATGQPEVQPAPAKPGKHPYLMVRTDRDCDVRETHVLWRGNVRTPGPPVSPGVPLVLSSVAPVAWAADDQPETADSGISGRRLRLAEWIVSDGNPLFWRVMANRVWQHHFGRGLVGTPGNFGRRGERPTHPALLDWLAVELRDNGGRLKPLHRLIVTSAVYRQSSAAEGQGHSADPENRLLWRMNRRRLEAEPLRDAILAVSGNLNPAGAGPGIKPRIREELLVASQRNKWPVVKQEGPEHWRRSVYVYVKRQLQLPMLELFDAPNTNHSCDRRRRSMVPTQPLVLMNTEFTREQAAAFAGRVSRECGATEDLSRPVELALWTALGHAPPADRVTGGAAFVREQTTLLRSEGMDHEQARQAALADFCHVLFNLSEFVYVD